MSNHDFRSILKLDSFILWRTVSSSCFLWHKTTTTLSPELPNCVPAHEAQIRVFELAWNSRWRPWSISALVLRCSIPNVFLFLLIVICTFVLSSHKIALCRRAEIRDWFCVISFFVLRFSYFFWFFFLFFFSVFTGSGFHWSFFFLYHCHTFFLYSSPFCFSYLLFLRDGERA